MDFITETHIYLDGDAVIEVTETHYVGSAANDTSAHIDEAA